MTSEEITNRVSVLNGYLATIHNIFCIDGDNSVCFGYYYGKQISQPILDGTSGYDTNTYNLIMECMRNNSFLFTIEDGIINLKKVNMNRHIIVAGDMYTGGEYTLAERFKLDSGYIEPSTFYEFQYIPTNPFFYSTSNVNGIVKGKYLQYNPPKFINQDDTNNISILNYITLEQRDNPVGESIEQVEKDRMLPLLQSSDFIAIMEDFINTVILNESNNTIEYLNNSNTNIDTYGIAINHLMEWIYEEIGALTNTQTVRTNWQTRLSLLTNPLQVQNGIAEALNLKSVLGGVEYGGDIAYANLRPVIYFTDKFTQSDMENKVTIAGSLKVASSQLITTSEFKKMLFLEDLSGYFEFQEESKTYTTTSRTEDGSISITQHTYIALCGYPKFSIFGALNFRFNIMAQYCFTFDAEWKERCEFDKIVGIVLIIIGAVLGIEKLIELGLYILAIIQLVLTIFILSGRGSRSEQRWARIASLAINVYAGWESFGNQAGQEITTKYVLDNLNLVLINTNEFYRIMLDYQQENREDDIANQQKALDDLKAKAVDIQNEFMEFVYTDSYNLYDNLYDYDRFYQT